MNRRTFVASLIAVVCISPNALAADPPLTPQQREALRQVKSVHLKVTENYTQAKELRLPVAKMIEAILEAGGLDVVDSSIDAPAEVEVAIQGTPQTAKGEDGVLFYTGCSVECRITVRSGEIVSSATIKAAKEPFLPPANQQIQYLRPEAAPYQSALFPRLVAKLPPLAGDLFGADQAKMFGAVLASKDSLLRGVAVRALAKLGPSAVEPLSRALKDSDRFVRYSAADSLGKTGSLDAVAPLEAALEDTDEAVRETAVRSLVALKPPKLKDLLLAAMKNTSWKVRGVAATGLAAYDDDAARQAVLAACEDPHSSVRYYAAAALAKRGASAVPGLQKLLSHTNREVRISAISALGDMQVAERLEPLILALLDADQGVAEAAHKAVTKYSPEPVKKPVEPLLTVLEKGSVWAKASAAMLLPDSEDPRAVEPLIQALQGDNAELRPYAANAFTRLKDPQAVEPLLAALGSDVPLLRSQAALALGSQEDKQALEPLLARLRDEDAEVRKSVVLALGKIRDRRAVVPILPFLKDETVEMRAQAAWSLGMLGGPEAHAALVAALKDTADFVRHEAALAIGLCREPQAFEVLAPLLKSDDVHMVNHAVHGLGESGDAKAVRLLLEESLHKRIAETDGVLAGSIRTALQKICGDSLEPLVTATKDADAAVRAHALWALNSLGGDAQLALILNMADDPSPRVRSEVADLLAFRSGQKDHDALLALVRDADESARRAAARSLGQRKHASAFEPLVAALKDPQPRVRSAAAESLGLLKDSRAVPHLLKALDDPDGDVKYFARGALRALGQESETDDP